MMQTDEEIIEKFMHGDSEAFGSLVERYQTEVFQWILPFVKNDAHAKDIAQGTFLKAYLKLHTLKRPEKFKYWLRSIAINESRLWLRDWNDNTVLPISAVITILPSPQNPEARLISKELVDAVLEAIDLLPEEERQVIKAHLAGKSHREIAHEQGYSYKAMTHRLYNARKKVSDKIKRLMIIFPYRSVRTFLKKVAVLSIKAGTVTKIGIGIVASIGLGGLVLLNLSLPDEEEKREYIALQVEGKRQIVDERPSPVANQRVKTAIGTKTEPVVTTRADGPSEEEWREFEACLDELEAALSAPPAQERDIETSETPIGAATSPNYEALEKLITERIQIVRQWKAAVHDLERFGFVYVTPSGYRGYQYNEADKPIYDAFYDAEKTALNDLDRNTKAIAELFPSAIANVQYDEKGTPFIVGKEMKLDFGKIEQALGRPLAHAQEILWLKP